MSLSNRSNASWVRAICLGFAMLSLVAGAAQAQVVTEFSAGITAAATPIGITAGPDGNLWFTEQNGNRIGRITTAGVVTEFSAGITAAAAPTGITAGPDGNLWFTEFNGNRIGRITTAGVVTEFSAGITAGAAPYGITAGPDGNLWFTEFNGNRIGRITTAGVVTEFSAGITASAGPLGITAGPDGNLWFTEVCRPDRADHHGRSRHRVQRRHHRPCAHPYGITAGPDGNLWFTEFPGNRIGRITPAGVVTEFSAGITALADPRGITAGPDGNLWFTEFNCGNRIGRITPAGVVTEFSAGITAPAGPVGIIAGPDGNLWFTEAADRIGRITTGATVAPPTIVKSFGAASIPLNGSTSLSFTIDNPERFTALTGVGFTDTLPAGLVVSTPNGLTGSCGGGTITATAGSGAVSLAGATLAASCLVHLRRERDRQHAGNEEQRHRRGDLGRRRDGRHGLGERDRCRGDSPADDRKVVRCGQHPSERVDLAQLHAQQPECLHGVDRRRLHRHAAGGPRGRRPRTGSREAAAAGRSRRRPGRMPSA